MKNNKQRLFEVMGRLDKTFSPLNEAQAVPFSGGFLEDANIYHYTFSIDGVDMVCNIGYDSDVHYDGHYEIGFGVEGRDDNYRVGKDIRFLNTVLETVTNCVKDFIDKEPNVKTVTFSGSIDKNDRSEPWISTLRSNVYLRYVKNKFPEMEVNQDRFGTITIKVREKTNTTSEPEIMKDVIQTVSDNSDIPENALQTYINKDYGDNWSLETDYGVNSKKGDFLIEVNKDPDYGYSVKIELMDSGEEVNEDFHSFDVMKNFVLNYFK